MWVLIIYSLGTFFTPPAQITLFTSIPSEADCNVLRDSFNKEAGAKLAPKLRGICILPSEKGPSK